MRQMRPNNSRNPISRNKGRDWRISGYNVCTPPHRTSSPTSRLDRLAWGRFHWPFVTALGATWILDGLEITLVGSLSGAIADKAALGLSSTRIGFTASAYLAGAVLGALIFGHLVDRMGRKRLFTVTVGVYLVATLLTGLAQSDDRRHLCRCGCGDNDCRLSVFGKCGGLMLAAAITEALLGVAAERKSLEDAAAPLSSF